jgi:hypothetical protein
MKTQRPDGRSVRDLLERALERSSTGDCRAPTGDAAPGAARGSLVVAGEVVDTHHPHLPGRVLVRWCVDAEREETAWLHHERHLSLLRGDRVLVTAPLGWPEWVITGALSRVAAEGANGDAAAGSAEPRSEPTALSLGPGERLLIKGHDGQPLLCVQQGPDGPIIELERDQVEIKARRRLRLTADTIELAAGHGGVDVRTEGEAVVRAHTIRLN